MNASTDLIRDLKILQSMFHLLLGQAVDVSKCLFATVVLSAPGCSSGRVRGEDVLD